VAPACAASTGQARPQSAVRGRSRSLAPCCGFPGRGDNAAPRGRRVLRASLLASQQSVGVERKQRQTARSIYFAISKLTTPSFAKGYGNLTDSPIYALRWAISKGYPVPPKKLGRWFFVVVIIGFFAGFVPGIIEVFYYWYRSEQSKKQLDALMIKWIDAGRP